MSPNLFAGASRHVQRRSIVTPRLTLVLAAFVRAIHFSPRLAVVHNGWLESIHSWNYGHHVHAYVPGELMGMFQSKTGTLTGLQPGRHILELRVVAEDHRTELDAFDHVKFTVK